MLAVLVLEVLTTLLLGLQVVGVVTEAEVLTLNQIMNTVVIMGEGLVVRHLETLQLVPNLVVGLFALSGQVMQDSFLQQEQQMNNYYAHA